MKLQICGPCPHVDLLEKAFAYASKKLGLDSVNGTVALCYFPSWKMPVTAFAATAPEFKNGVVKMCISSAAFDGGELAAIESFMHELVHVRQIVSGELVVDKTGAIIWKGKHFAPSALRRSQEIDTADESPWEKEAYRLSPEWVYPFFVSLGYSEKALRSQYVTVDTATSKRLAKRQLLGI